MDFWTSLGTAFTIGCSVVVVSFGISTGVVIIGAAIQLVRKL